MNLINLIYEVQKKEEIYEKKSHYPSEVNKCIRQIWYKWKNIEPSNPITPQAWVKMKMGNAIHDLVFRWLEKSGIEIVNEISGEKRLEGLKYPIRYRLDNIAIDKDLNKMIGIEIKTGFARGIDEIKKQNKPKDEHLNQVLLYMLISDIDIFHILYIARDNGYMYDFLIDIRADKYCIDGRPIEFDVKELYQQFFDIEKTIEKPEPPEREYMVIIKNGEIKDKIQKDKIIYKTDWQCQYCQWRDLCWKDVLEKYNDYIPQINYYEVKK